jgi:predicted nucleotidyltransferase component of viral defense system
MIPYDFVTEWRDAAPWTLQRYVEQDLALSRAIVELFARPTLAEAFAFRGGTALYKLHLTPAARYSEDLDLVQVRPGPIGPLLDEIRSALEPWLGTPQFKYGGSLATLSYRFESEDLPSVRMKLKVEINTREHFTEFGFASLPFSVRSRWFSGEAAVTTYGLDELLGTKLRALYQRKKGRDLFDLALALRKTEVAPTRIVAAFSRYMKEQGVEVGRRTFEENLAKKRHDPFFAADMTPLLAAGTVHDFEADFDLVSKTVVAALP